MKELWRRLDSWMNDCRLSKKLRILYILCVLIPLIVTDSAIFYIVIQVEQEKQQHEMENEASAVQYNFSNSVERAASLAENIYMNRYINAFLNQSFATPLDYFEAYQDLLKDTLLESSLGIDNNTVTMYADNETVINGGKFARLSSVKDSVWYQDLVQSGMDTILCIYYDDSKEPAVDARRRVLLIRRLNFYGKSECEKIVKVEIDYSNLVRNLVRMNYPFPVSICGDRKVFFSTTGSSGATQKFENYDQKKSGYHKNFTLYGADMQIQIQKPDMEVLSRIRENIPLILLLIVSNAVLPWILMTEINRSITVRIRELSQVFERVELDQLKEIAQVRGRDEIGSLMYNYNCMAKRMNDLIKTVYKDKLREQEMDIARQNAELLALRSQINPHFLFNTLESIRMHSILKQEYETADAVERLAVMERQYVEWGEDLVELGREMEFVEAYLGLQKYRFGDRLSYQLEIEESCTQICIPKLTLVTFVENACAHGIESKAALGWIFVRVYPQGQGFCIEVEDTGEGMEEAVRAELLAKMKNASIEMLREPGRVGIVNACLRLKKMNNSKVDFSLESEKGIGTTVQIQIVQENERCRKEEASC